MIMELKYDLNGENKMKNNKKNLQKRLEKHNENWKFFITPFILFILLILITSQIYMIHGQSQNIGDTDNDNIPDNIDTDDDGDGFNDTFELQMGTDPLDGFDYPIIIENDFDGDGLLDNIDPDDDNDGLFDQLEYNLSTDPKAQDTDRDHVLDGKEMKLGTDPLSSDTDMDGFTDGEEVFANTNPKDKTDFPKTVIANAGLDKVVYPNEKVILKAGLSLGKNLNYTWDFDSSDGLQIDSYKMDEFVKYQDEGIFNVTLTVTDGNTNDSDTCTIIVSKRFACHIEIIKSQVRNYNTFYDNINLELKERKDKSFIFSIEGTLKTNAIIGICIDSHSMLINSTKEIRLKYDNKIINDIPLINVISAKDKSASYNVTYHNNKIYLIVNVPEFSQHLITIEKIDTSIKDEPGRKRIQEDFHIFVYMGILIVAIVLVIIITYFRILAINKMNEEKFYSKMRIDDEIKLELFEKLKSRNINWEDYDSDKK